VSFWICFVANSFSTADLTGTTFGGLDKTDLVHEEHPLALKRGAPAPEGFKATAKARTGLSLAARREAASNQDGKSLGKRRHDGRHWAGSASRFGTWFGWSASRCGM